MAEYAFIHILVLCLHNMHWLENTYESLTAINQRSRERKRERKTTRKEAGVEAGKEKKRKGRRERESRETGILSLFQTSLSILKTSCDTPL